VVAERDRPLTLGRPDPAQDRLQPEAVLVRGPDLNVATRITQYQKGRFVIRSSVAGLNPDSPYRSACM
jgi:hypothetical protein